MDFEYTEDQLLLQNSIKGFFSKNFPSSYVREFIDDPSISEKLVKDLSNQGLLEIIGDDEDSLSEGLTYSVLTSYESGRAILPFQVLESHIASYILKKYTDNDQMANQLSSGEKIFTMGWNTQNVQINNNKVNGSISFVPFALFSDYMIASVEINDKNSILLLIDLKDNSKLNIDVVNSMDQTYPLYKVTFKDYEFNPKDILVEDINQTISKEISYLASLLISAEMIGGSEEILEKTVEYTKERQQFGQEIAKFQAVKHQAAEMYLLLESSKAALKYATWALSSNQESELDTVIPLLKSYVSESCNELIGKGIQLHGGIGFTWESDVHLYYKRARRNSLMHGDANYHKEQLFKQLI